MKTKSVLDRFRLRLAGVDAVPQLALMGVATGLVTGIVIILFRFLIETSQSWFLPDANAENYEDLPSVIHFGLPLLGAVCIALIWLKFDEKDREVGIVHVLERLAYHQAYLPVKNFILQFVGGAICIVSGFSVGREGPGVHLGAASASLLGQFLTLPNNALRVLVACGAAASIAAFHSKGRGSALLPVAYCERKFVRRPRGAPPGSVVMDRETVVIVEPRLPDSG